MDRRGAESRADWASGIVRPDPTPRHNRPTDNNKRRRYPPNPTTYHHYALPTHNTQTHTSHKTNGRKLHLKCIHGLLIPRTCRHQPPAHQSRNQPNHELTTPWTALTTPISTPLTLSTTTSPFTRNAHHKIDNPAQHRIPAQIQKTRKASLAASIQSGHISYPS